MNKDLYPSLALIFTCNFGANYKIIHLVELVDLCSKQVIVNLLDVKSIEVMFTSCSFLVLAKCCMVEISLNWESLIELNFKLKLDRINFKVTHTLNSSGKKYVKFRAREVDFL